MPTPTERDERKKDRFELCDRLRPFVVNAPDGSMWATSRRRNRFTETIPYLCLHQKTLVIDGDIAFIGSYNFDPRSGNLNTEVALVVRDAAFASLVQRDIENDLQPRNSYRIARRRLPLGLAAVNRLLHRVSELSPIDPWPIRFASSFELRDGGTPVSTDHENFYDHWRDAGSFPLLGHVSTKRLLTRLFKTFGGVLVPLL